MGTACRCEKSPRLKLKFTVVAVLGSIAAGLTNCSKFDVQGSAMPASPSASQLASRGCGPPPSTLELEVLFPEPGARNAPPSLANIYIATKVRVPAKNEFDFFLTQSDGDSTFTGPFVRISGSEVPEPHSKPKYAHAKYYASAVSGPHGSSYLIGPNQRVKLAWNDGVMKCRPNVVVSRFRTKS